MLHFNPQGSCEPRLWMPSERESVSRFQSTRLSRASTPFSPSPHQKLPDFNPQGSREPRRRYDILFIFPIQFQSTRLSRASTYSSNVSIPAIYISIHKALASLDFGEVRWTCGRQDFNPQGSREPRRLCTPQPASATPISIHKALASLDGLCRWKSAIMIYFNPQGSREPRPRTHCFHFVIHLISIHKALASLDTVY